MGLMVRGTRMDFSELGQIIELNLNVLACKIRIMLIDSSEGFFFSGLNDRCMPVKRLQTTKHMLARPP